LYTGAKSAVRIAEREFASWMCIVNSLMAFILQLTVVLCSCSQSNNHSAMSAQHHASQQQYGESPDDANLKKKRDRFKGMSEDEVLMRMLPDHLIPNLDIVVVSC